MPLSPAAARLITLGRTARSAPQQQVNPYDLEQEESLLSRVGQGTLGAVSAVGNLLDLPSSMARDVLTWMPGGTPEQNPFDQLLSPLSDTNRISGRELLSGAGFMAPNKETGMSGWLDDPMEAVRDIAGFGAEAVLDFPGFWGVKQAAKLGGKGLKRLPGAMPAARLGQRAVDPLRRYSKQLFHAPSGQRKTQIGQSVAERRFHQRETLRQSVMGRVTSSMRSLEKKGRLTQIESMRQRKMLEGILDVDEAILPELDNLMRLKDDIYERGAALGFPDHELDDVIDHMFRRMGGWVKDVYRAPAERSSGGLREFMTNIRDQKKRLDAFRGFDQGTEGVNRLFLDSMWDDIIEADPLDAAAKTMDTSRDHARAFMTTHPDALHPDTRRIWDSLPSDRQATLTRAITSQREDMVHAIVARQMVRNGIAEKYGDEIAETYIRRDNEGFRFFDEQGGVHHLSKSTIDELEDLGDGTFRWIDEPVGTGGPGFERIIRPDEADRLQELADMIVDIPEFRERGIFTNHWLDDMRESLLAQGTAHLNAEAIYEGLARSVTDELEYAIRLKSGDYKKTVGDLLRHPDFKPKYNVAIKQVADKMGITRAGMTIREQAAEAAKKIGGDDEMIDALEAGITKDLKNLDRRVVPDAEFNDLLGFVSSTQLADELNPLAKGIASFNNLFKMSVLTWPARYVRDRMSGAFRNVEAFVQSPKQLMQYFVAEKDAHKLLQGRMVGGLEHIPAVKQWMSQAGLEGPEGAAEAVKQMYHAWHGDMPSLWSDVAGVDEAIRSGADLVGDPRHLMENFPGETPLDAGNLFRTAVGRGRGGSLNPLETRGVYSRKTGDLRRDTAFGPAQAGEQVGRYTDNANRVAPFLFMLRGRAGDSLESAADAMRQVNQAQIDYAARNFTPTERNLKLFFPFYSFMSRNLPWVARQLWNKPHGTLGQVIRAQRLASDDRASTPEFIRQQGGAFLRHKPDGTKSFLNALGTMHEDALNMLGGPQDMALELASRLSPVFKFPLEAATGQSLFQRGPWGGRRLGDLDPPVGRLMNNVSRMFGGEEIRRPQPLMGSQILEHMIANSPLSRAVSTARTLTDLRKNVPERLMNTLTGLRVTDVSPLQQQRHLQQQLDFLSDQLGASQFTIRHFPDWFVERLSPEARARVEAAQQLQKMLEARRQSRR